MPNEIQVVNPEYLELTLPKAIHYWERELIELESLTRQYDALNQTNENNALEEVRQKIELSSQRLDAIGYDLACIAEPLTNLCNCFEQKESKIEAIMPMPLVLYGVRELTCNFNLGDVHYAALSKGETILSKLAQISNKWHALRDDKEFKEFVQGDVYDVQGELYSASQISALEKSINVIEQDPSIQKYLHEQELAFPYQDLTMKELKSLCLVVDEALIKSDEMQKTYNIKDVTKNLRFGEKNVEQITARMVSKFEEAVSMLAGASCAALGSEYNAVGEIKGESATMSTAAAVAHDEHGT